MNGRAPIPRTMLPGSPSSRDFGRAAACLSEKPRAFLHESCSAMVYLEPLVHGLILRPII